MGHLSSCMVRGFAVVIGLSIFAVDAGAQATRPYQMSILTSTDGATAAGVDIPTFMRGVSRYDPQPAGRSIVWLPPGADLDVHDSNDYDLIDWSRIVAVYVDEPYGTMLANRSNCPQSLEHAAGLEYAARKSQVAALAADARRKAPTARFWVNFTSHEIDLLLDENSNCDFNQSYIDVISMDLYGQNFSPALSSRYDDLYANHRATPHQQLALIPGVFTGGHVSQTNQQAITRMSGYLSYAATMNQQCNLPLGPSRISGIYDRCPVWMIAGWLGGTVALHEASYDFYPIDHEFSGDVLYAWNLAFSVPRVDPSRVRAVRDLIPLLDRN